jgi:hypothetical protein
MRRRRRIDPDTSAGGIALTRGVVLGDEPKRGYRLHLSE